MITIETNWTSLKSFATSRSVSIQYVDFNGNYYLAAMDNFFAVQTLISKEDSENEDLIDFETNYKANANKPVTFNSSVQSQPAFGSKTILINGATKKLYARFTGIQSELSTGDNEISHTVTYPWAKVIGIEVINCEALDTASLKVYDNALGSYSGTPNLLLNQFSFDLNLCDNYYQRIAQFDADIYQGMVIKVEYNSISEKTIGINILFNEVKT